MEYPMPDNMGFARRGITDMLPDEIAAADMAAVKRHMQNEAMGLRECKCAECGRHFIAHVEHRYKHMGKTKQKMYCSYRCYRVEERKQEEAWKERKLNAWCKKRTKTAEEVARDRVSLCAKKYEAWKARQSGEEWEAATKDKRKNIAQKTAYWHARLLVAEQELEDVKKQ